MWNEHRLSKAGWGGQANTLYVCSAYGLAHHFKAHQCNACSLLSTVFISWPVIIILVHTFSLGPTPSFVQRSLATWHGYLNSLRLSFAMLEVLMSYFDPLASYICEPVFWGHSSWGWEFKPEIECWNVSTLLCLLISRRSAKNFCELLGAAMVSKAFVRSPVF